MVTRFPNAVLLMLTVKAPSFSSKWFQTHWTSHQGRGSPGDAWIKDKSLRSCRDMVSWEDSDPRDPSSPHRCLGRRGAVEGPGRQRPGLILPGVGSIHHSHMLKHFIGVTLLNPHNSGTVLCPGCLRKEPQTEDMVAQLGAASEAKSGPSPGPCALGPAPGWLVAGLQVTCAFGSP